MEGRLIQHVELQGTGYTLKLFDDDRYLGDRHYLSYEFATPDGTILFSGSDFGLGASMKPRSDDAARCLLGFLTMREYDVEADYFKDYTEAQLAFRDGPDCEYLQCWGMEDLGDSEEVYEFVDLPIDPEETED